MGMMDPRHAAKGGKGDGAESAKPPQPAPETVDAELSYIAGVLARDHSVKVSLGAPGEGSYASLEEKAITLDPKQLTNPAQARFVAAHEGAHIGETLSLEQSGLKTLQQQQEYSRNIGLHSLRNVIEDCAINDRLAKKYPNLQPDVLAAYPRQSENDPIGIIALPEVQAITAMTGKPPLYAQALAGLSADWAENRHQLGFDKTLEEYQARPRQGGKTDEPKLKKFFDAVLQEARKATSFIPGPDDPASTSVEMCEKRIAWTEHVLYPELKKLVQEDKNSLTEAIQKHADKPGSEFKEALEKALAGHQGSEQGKEGQGQNQKQGKGGQGEGQEQSEGQEGGGQQGKGQGKPGQKKPGQQSKGAQGEGQEESEGQDGEGQQGKGQGKQQGNKKTASSGGKSSQGGSRDSDSQQTNKQKGGAGSGASQHGEQSEEQKGNQSGISEAEAGRLAAEVLAQAEDAIRKLLESLKEQAEGTLPSAKDVITQRNDQERKEEAAREAAEQNTLIGKQLQEALLNSLAPYHQEYHQVARAIEDAYSRLSDTFDPERHFKWEQDLPSGNKLKMDAAMRFELTGEGHERIWMRRIDPQYPDQDIVIILDRSGSMEEHDKYIHARRGLLFARELFQRLHIPTACVGFSSSSELFIDFEDDIGEPDVQELFMRHTGSPDGGTDDESAIKYAASLLLERDASKKTIIMLSDAQSGSADLKGAVQKVAEQGIPVLHFGIGVGTRDAGGHYIHSWGDLSLAPSGDNSFLEVFCREMVRLAEGILDQRT